MKIRPSSRYRRYKFSSRSEALAARRPLYDAGDGLCTTCSSYKFPWRIGALRYLTNDNCLGCSIVAAAKLRKYAIDTLGLPWSVRSARAQNSTVYAPADPCSKHGHASLKSIYGDCLVCLALRQDPRSRAVLAGLAWYAPVKPCKYCGTLAPRTVERNICSCAAYESDRAIIDRAGPRPPVTL